VRRTVIGLFDHYLDERDPAGDGAGTGDGAARDDASRIDADRIQEVVDYIAGMTDRFAIATYRRLALPEESRL
jgi:dGTP triphosphohydrolase